MKTIRGTKLRFALLLTLLNVGWAEGEPLSPISIDDYVRRFQIPLISLAPDGQHVAYLTIQGLPHENCYEVTERLVATSGTRRPVLLARYRVQPKNVFDANSGSVQKAAGQFAWSPEGKELAYTNHVGSNVQVRIRNSRTGYERVLLTNATNIEIDPADGGLDLRAPRPAYPYSAVEKDPPDDALLIKDGYRFYQKLSNPKTQRKVVLEHWRYSWRDRHVVKMNFSSEPYYPDMPEEWVPSSAAGRSIIKNTRDTNASYRDTTLSPDGTLVAAAEDSRSSSGTPPVLQRTSRIVIESLNDIGPSPNVLVSSETPRVVYTVLGWSRDSKQLYYAGTGPQYSTVNSVSLDGRIHVLYKEACGFSFPSPAFEVSRNRATIVFVRSTNLIPDELVKVDMNSGSLVVLSSPNGRFRGYLLPKVRFVPIECCGGKFFGRLFLPADYVKGKKYPMVFTNYISTPGFYASVGDEVPILTLTAHGIAVFTMNSSDANILSSTADFSLEISRVQEPVAAMEWVRQRLSDEGMIDPNRCGLTGLSYGAEIAMYAYWRSPAFRAISVASASWEPMNYLLAGISYSKFLDSRGFGLPGPQSYANWKAISAGLNARPDLPPLLVQSSDGEEYFGNIETWIRLRRAGAQIEWFEYPHEGHVKRSPANRWWVYKRNLAWFCFWLKDEIDPDLANNDQYTRWREMRRQRDALSSKAAIN
jgi:dipeptidyl aminopeptidase/acylaminoacyl peptidase